jgi:hypothetical protein
VSRTDADINNIKSFGKNAGAFYDFMTNKNNICSFKTKAAGCLGPDMGV